MVWKRATSYQLCCSHYKNQRLKKKNNPQKCVQKIKCRLIGLCIMFCYYISGTHTICWRGRDRVHARQLQS